MIVRDLLHNRSSEALVLRSGMSALEAACFFQNEHVGGAPVVDDGRLVGFCSERDLVFRVMALALDPRSAKVRDIMSQTVITASPDETLEHCELLLREHHCRHLPILEGGRVIACLSLRDFLQSELREREEEINHLREYIQGAG